MNIYAYGDARLVKAELDTRYLAGHIRRQRPESSLQVIRRSLARARRLELPRD